jgi:hypothetical protein
MRTHTGPRFNVSSEGRESHQCCLLVHTQFLVLNLGGRLVGCTCLPSMKKMSCKQEVTTHPACAPAGPEIVVTPSSTAAFAAYRRSHSESPELSVRLLNDTLPVSSSNNHKPSSTSLFDKGIVCFYERQTDQIKSSLARQSYLLRRLRYHNRTRQRRQKCQLRRRR